MIISYLIKHHYYLVIKGYKKERKKERKKEERLIEQLSDMMI